MRLACPKLGQISVKTHHRYYWGSYVVLIFLVSVINFLIFVNKFFGVGIKFAPARRMKDAISAQQVMDDYTQTSCTVFC